jgi:hypothetical protein
MADDNLNQPAPDYTSYAIAMFGPAIGSVLMSSEATPVDTWASMQVFRTTTCTEAATPVCSENTVIDYLNPLTTNVTNITSTYSVPAAAMLTGARDDVRATVVTTLPAETVTQNDDQLVAILPNEADAGPGDGGTGSADGGEADAGPVDAGPVDAGPCVLAGGCSLTACDEKACTTKSGTPGVCDTTSALCEAGNLLVLTEDISGTRINPDSIALGAPWVAFTAQDLVGSLGAGDTVTFNVSSTSIGGLSTVQPTAGVVGTASVQVSNPSSNLAKVYFIPGNSAGTATLTVNVTGAQTESQSLSIGVVLAGTVVFTPAASDPFFKVMGVKSSGYNQSSLLRFTVQDSSGNPVSGTATVAFTVPSLGGALVSPAAATTDVNGQVTTTLLSGTVMGTVSVTATATLESGATITGTSGSISIVGAKASGKNFAVSCTDEAINALVGNNCAQMLQDLSVDCTATLADRFNNVLGVSVQLSWMSESGFFGPPSSTQAAVAGADPTTEPNLGRSSNTLYTQNASLPENVDGLAAYAGEPTQSVTDLCGTRVARPRDGLVTYIASTQGEEGFIDANGNGVYDSGEEFFDLGEPYVDENDNNQWDPGEPFVDVNGNGSYDGPNGVWDANTTIWTEGHIVFTNTPTGTISLVPTAVPAPLAFNVAQSFTVLWQDENLNEPAPLFTHYSSALGVPSAGSFVQTSVLQQPDSFGSMALIKKQVCNGLACSLNTYIDFVSSSEQGGIYTAPNENAAPSGFTDTIDFTATLTDANTNVVAQQVESYDAPCDTTSSATVNCLLPACGGQTCSAAGVPGLCDASSGVCVANQQAGGTFTLNLAITNAEGNPVSRVPAGSSALTLTATLSSTAMASAAANQTVTFSIPAGLGTLASTATGSSTATTLTVTTDSAGLAIAYLTPENVGPATGDITATFDQGESTQIQIQQVLTVVIPSVLVFNASNSGFFDIMGVKSSGYNEMSVIEFQLLDSSGQPYVGTATVNFTIPELGGATLVPSSINTNANGYAQTALYSGVSAGTIAVSAKTSIQLSSTTTVTITGTSSTVAVVGAKANGRNFAMECSPEALPALFGNDCTYMHANLTSTCTVVIGDRFNNVLGVSNEVTWLSEAGLFGPPSSTPVASPGVDPTTEPDLGISANTLRTFNTRLPENVDTQTAYALSVEPTNAGPDGCGNTNTRPRDGLSTVIAATQGEEGFVDVNENGQWDPGEPFYDIGEPYVDSNDNNQYDLGEPFIDVNGNGVWDGPNGTWDANTTIWTTFHVAFTGNPTARTWTPNSLGSVAPGENEQFTVFWADSNLNIPAELYSTYAVAMLGQPSGTVQLLTPASLFDGFGAMSIQQLTTCGPPPTAEASSCTAASPNCDCSIKQSISFSQAAEMTAEYSVPSSVVAGVPADEVEANVTTNISGDIVDISTRYVTIQ